MCLIAQCNVNKPAHTHTHSLKRLLHFSSPPLTPFSTCQIGKPKVKQQQQPQPRILPKPNKLWLPCQISKNRKKKTGQEKPTAKSFPQRFHYILLWFSFFFISLFFWYFVIYQAWLNGSKQKVLVAGVAHTRICRQPLPLSLTLTFMLPLPRTIQMAALAFCCWCHLAPKNMQ